MISDKKQTNKGLRKKTGIGWGWMAALDKAQGRFCWEELFDLRPPSRGRSGQK